MRVSILNDKGSGPIVLTIFIALAAAAFLAQFLSHGDVRNYWEKTASLADETSQIEKGSVAALIWEMRAGSSDMLWLKTDEYMHDGLSHAGCGQDHSDQDEQEGLMGSEHDHTHENDDHVHGPDCVHEEELAHIHGPECDHENEMDILSDEHSADGVCGSDCEHDHELDPEHVIAGEPAESTATAVASNVQKRKRVPFGREARPWQGVLGKVSELTDTVGKHRITKRKEEMLPWFRIVTLLNPNHVRAYRTGSFWLATYVKDPSGALQFAMEGLRNNPKDPEIQFIIGRIYFYNLDDPVSALPYFQEAIRCGQGITVKDRTDAQAQAIVDGYRHVAYCHKSMGNIAQAMSAIAKGLKMWPRDKAMQDYLKTLEALQDAESGIEPVSKA